MHRLVLNCTIDAQGVESKSSEGISSTLSTGHIMELLRSEDSDEIRGGAPVKRFARAWFSREMGKHNDAD